MLSSNSRGRSRHGRGGATGRGVRLKRFCAATVLVDWGHRPLAPAGSLPSVSCPSCSFAGEPMAGGHTLRLKQGPGPRDARHPERIRPGQVFFPRVGRRRRPMTVRSVEGEWVRVTLDDLSERRLALDRLLAVDRAGVGAHYRFQGWKPRARGYRAAISVVAVDAARGRCRLVLPEWDATTEVDDLLSVLPATMREVGATGSCMANLASPSAGGLGIHSCRPTAPRGLSRASLGPHPDDVVEGQEFRRVVDGVRLRVVEVDPSSSGVVAWNGKRRVRLTRARLLVQREDGTGRHYLYLGGGLREARRQRQAM